MLTFEDARRIGKAHLDDEDFDLEPAEIRSSPAGWVFWRIYLPAREDPEMIYLGSPAILVDGRHGTVFESPGFLLLN